MNGYKDHIKIGSIWFILTSIVGILVYYFSGAANVQSQIAVLQTQQTENVLSIADLKTEFTSIQTQLSDLKVSVGSITNYFRINQKQ